MSFNGDYRSLAEAVGETTHHRGWVAGVDFDPADPEEMEVMSLVFEREKADRVAQLEAENARLRAQLEALQHGHLMDDQSAAALDDGLAECPKGCGLQRVVEEGSNSGFAGEGVWWANLACGHQDVDSGDPMPYIR